MTVGTQSAVLAAVNTTMFIEFVPSNFASEPNDWGDLDPAVAFLQRCIKFVYYVTIVIALMSNLLVVSHTTVLALMGTSLALRGPDGSMVVATEGLYAERALIFKTFGRGLLCTVAAAGIVTFLVLRIEAAVVCAAICMYAGREIVRFYNRVLINFQFDENSEAIDLSDMFDGPANIIGKTSDNFNRAMMRANGIRELAGQAPRRQEQHLLSNSTRNSLLRRSGDDGGETVGFMTV